MTLARDSSSPVSNATDDPGTQTATQVSKTFSPPAGSVIIVNAVALSSGVSDWSATPFAITDSLGSHLSWNLKVDRYDNSDSQYSERIAVFWAYCPSAQTNMTVSVTVGTTTGQYIFGIDCKPDVWTGANTSGPVGAVISGTAASSNTLSEAITPTAAGSALVLYGGPTFDGTANPTAGSGCYGVNPGSSAVYFLGEWYGTSGGPTLTPNTSPVTMAMTFTGPQTWQYVGYEVLAAAGAVTAAGTLSVSGTAAGQAPASAAAAVTLAGTAAARAPAAATGALAVSGSAAAAAPVTVAGSAAFAGTASATGPGAATAAGALAVTGTASATAPAPAAGSVTVAGTAAAAAPAGAGGSLALTGTATAAAPSAPAAGSVTVAGTATARAAAAPAGSLVLAGTATASAQAAAAGNADLTGTAAASGPGVTASAALALAGTAAARAPAAATGAVTLAGAAATRAAGGAAGAVTITGTALFLPPFTVGTLTASDTRTGGPS
jgi:hypothetical protein